MQRSAISPENTDHERIVPGFRPEIDRNHSGQHEAEAQEEQWVISEKWWEFRNCFKIIVFVIYFFWILMTGSFSKSEQSSFLPLAMTSGCFLVRSHPTWAKKKPRLELWGSASVSLYLWCTLWSRHHSCRSFFRSKASVSYIELSEE